MLDAAELLSCDQNTKRNHGFGSSLVSKCVKPLKTPFSVFLGFVAFRSSFFLNPFFGVASNLTHLTHPHATFHSLVAWLKGQEGRFGQQVRSLGAMSKLNIDNLKKGHWDSTVRSWNWWLVKIMDVSAEFLGSYWLMVQYGLYMVNMGFQPLTNINHIDQCWVNMVFIWFNIVKQHQQWDFNVVGLSEIWRSKPGVWTSTTSHNRWCELESMDWLKGKYTGNPHI